MLAVFIKEGKGIKGCFSRRCIIWGGPLVQTENPEVLPSILKTLNRISLKKVIYTQIRNFFNTNEVKTIFESSGFYYEEHLNIHVDLTKTEESLWKDVHTKRRNEIRRAEKEGTSFEILKDGIQLEETYNILDEVYTRAKLPLPDLIFFRRAFQNLTTEYFKIFVAKNEGEIIGTMYTFCYGDTIYDWYAGSYQKYYKKYPNDLIPWKVFLWGRENGYKKFDFGGAGKPNIPYGVRDYKKKFGGEFVNFGRYEKINKPMLFQLAKVGFNIYQKMKK